MAQLFANLATATLAGGISASDTTLTIAANGALFPVADTGVVAIGPGADWFKAVLQNATTHEIIYVRTHTVGSNTFSDVIRGQEGTTAAVFSLGDVFAVRITAQDAEDAAAGFVERNQWDGGATGLTAATGRTSLGLGDAATLNTGTTAGTVAAGDHTHSGVYEPANVNIQTHVGTTGNPHGVTKADVGLSNVTNEAQVTNVTASGVLSSSGGTTPAITHSTADGSLHVPATGTTNNGKVLTAGATAGALSWETLTAGTVTSVGGTGTVSGLTLSGTVTTSGNLTLGGAITGFATDSHNHAGVYEPADATILKDADIGVTVQAYDADLTSWAAIAPSAKQDALVSGTNIKTVNSTSLLGSGNIVTGDVTLTGTETLTNKTITGTKETRVAMGANDIDLSAGNYFTKTISGTTTLTVSNVPSSGTAESFILDLTNGGSAAITFWSGTKWAGGTAPTLTSAGRDVLGFFTHDGGTTWTGLLLGLDVK